MASRLLADAAGAARLAVFARGAGACGRTFRIRIITAAGGHGRGNAGQGR